MCSSGGAFSQIVWKWRSRNANVSGSVTIPPATASTTWSRRRDDPLQRLPLQPPIALLAIERHHVGDRHAALFLDVAVELHERERSAAPSRRPSVDLPAPRRPIRPMR